MIFAVFDVLLAVNIVYKLQFFLTFYIHYYYYYYYRRRDGVMVWRWTCDQEVAGLTPVHSTFM